MSPTFDALVAPHLDAAFKLALVILHDRAEAEDAVQEAAVKAWRNLDRLRDATSGRAWFLSIVANHCRSVRRTRWWSVVKQADPLAGMLGRPDRLDDRLDLERALDRLPNEDRLVLFLHYYLDLPLEEVAVIAGRSVPAVRSRVYRAIERMRQSLHKQEVVS